VNQVGYPKSIKRLGDALGTLVFPPPPLKFRTSGFPQYGFKRECARRLSPGQRILWSEAPAVAVYTPRPLGPLPPVAPKGMGGTGRGPFSRAFSSRGPWLASGFCCPARSSLTMASSETLGPSLRLIFFVSASLSPRPILGVGPRGSPICSACLCPRAAFRTPAGPAAAPGCCFAAGTGLRLIRRGSAPALHALRFSRGRVTRLQSSLYATARGLASPSPARAFTLELSPPGSPQWGVEYHYAGTQPIPAARLSLARHAALWAANGFHGFQENSQSVESV